MSTDRESILALVLGGALAVLIHVGLAPATARLLEGDAIAIADRANVDRPDPEPERADDEEPEPPPEPESSPRERPQPPEPPEIPLGRDDAPERRTVAWISHEDFEQLVARQSTTEQPALQRDVVPTPDAPIVPDPTPLALASPPSAPQPLPQPQPERPATPESTTELEDVPPTQEPAAPPPVEDALTRDRSAQGPEPLPAEPIEQPRAEAEEIEPPDEFVPPTEQERAVAPRETDNPPSQADPTPTPQSLEPAPADQQTADALQPGTDRDRFEPAEAEDKRDTPPTDQPRAETDNPQDDGQPVTLDEASTPTPDDTGLPTRTTPPPTPDTPTPTPPIPDAPTPDTPTSDAPTPPSPSAAAQRARPTAAPQADSEVDPVSLTADPVRIQPGSVLTGRGITIKTARPDISVVSLLTAVPQANPTAKIVFNQQGKVINVTMLKTTGYPDLDAPIESSLYKWEASGKKLEELGRPFSLEITLLLSAR